MGICASCLGLNRHPSQENHNETDPLLDGRNAQYGGLDGGEGAHRDEEEMRREREALEQIAADATENMIDVSHRGTAQLSEHFAHANTAYADDGPKDRGDEQELTDEEAAWLQDIQAGDGEDVVTVTGLDSGALVLDMGTLREAPSPAPSASKRSPKGKLPA